MPLTVPAPIERASRLFIGIVALLLTIPLLAWFVCILGSIACGLYFIVHPWPSRAAVVWFTSQSTVYRTSDSSTASSLGSDGFHWYSSNHIAGGHTHVKSLGLGVTNIEVTHVVAIPLVIITTAGLVILAHRVALRRPHVPGRCDSCGYSTIGLASASCPECGAPLHEPRIRWSGGPTG